MTIGTGSVGTVAGTTNGSTGILSMTVATAVATGSLIVVVCTTQSNFTSTITDSKGNTYHAAVTRTNMNGSTANGNIIVSYAYNCIALTTSDTIIITSSTNIKIVSTAIYGTGIMTASDPLDSPVTATTTGSASSWTIAEAATPASALLSLHLGVVAGTESGSYGAISPTAPWSTYGDNNQSGSPFLNTDISNQTSTSLLTWAGTIGVSTPYAAAVMAFKQPAAVAGRIPTKTLLGVGQSLTGAAAFEGARRLLRNQTQTRREFFLPWQKGK